MASLTLTPTLTMVQKNADGSYDFTCAMNDAGGANRGFRTIHLNVDGTTTVNGVATGTTISGGNMTTLGNIWAACQTAVTTIDGAAKLPF
jgi:hypothetical protein